jgi:hypothetical protein
MKYMQQGTLHSISRPLLLFKMKRILITSLIGLLTHTAAAYSLPVTSELKQANPRASCEHTATSRQCWGDYDISTNWQVMQKIMS